MIKQIFAPITKCDIELYMIYDKNLKSYISIKGKKVWKSKANAIAQLRYGIIAFLQEQGIELTDKNIKVLKFDYPIGNGFYLRDVTFDYVFSYIKNHIYEIERIF